MSNYILDIKNSSNYTNEIREVMNILDKNDSMTILTSDSGVKSNIIKVMSNEGLHYKCVREENNNFIITTRFIK